VDVFYFGEGSGGCRNCGAKRRGQFLVFEEITLRIVDGMSQSPISIYVDVGYVSGYCADTKSIASANMRAIAMLSVATFFWVIVYLLLYEVYH
jgi:hypothetical protein